MQRPSDPDRLISLDDVRADGWFERLGGGSAAFAQLCQIVGDRFVAFSIVAGLRITALQVDGRSTERSTIEFAVGEGGPPQRMSLGDFRRRLANALIAEEDPPVELGPEPTSEELQAFLGVRNVLLAPILGIELGSLRLGDDGALVLVRVDGLDTELSVDDLRETVRDRIRAEAERYRSPAPFAIDLAVVAEADLAAQESRHERVVALLGGWPGPLSMILRTPEGQQITDEPRAIIVRGLGLLGSAYAALERNDWAEDVLRLGIQWGGEGPAAAELFRRLGDAYLGNERAGEAIGLYRRALALDGSHGAGGSRGGPDGLRSRTLTSLARAFAARRRHLAALLSVEDALAAGASEDAVREVREEALGALGEHWHRVQSFLAD